MSDEAQQDGAPRQRTAGQVTARQIAQNLALQISDLQDAITKLDGHLYAHIKQYEDDHIREKVRTHANSITALGDELHGFQTGITRQLDKIRDSLASVGPIMDGAASATAGDIQANRDRVDKRISEILARVEGAERALADLRSSATGGALDDLEDQAAMVTLAETVASIERRVAAVERGHEAGPTGGEGYATQLQVRVGKLEELLQGAAKAVEHLPVPGDLVERLETVERRLSLVGAISDVASTPVPGVHVKVLELMRQVEVIGKDRQADQGTGGKFKFRGIDEAMDAVGRAMRQVGLTLETEMVDKDYAHNAVTNSYTDRNTREEKQRTVLWTTATVTYRYIFVDPVDGSRHAFEMAGEGRDASDKATSKAGSMALKYGLFQALMIPVSGMDDGDTESPQVQQDRPTQRGQQADKPAAAQGEQQRPAARSKGERAVDAVNAVRNIGRHPVDKRLDVLIAISSRVEQEGLGNIEVEGATVRAHIAATERTLSPVADDPPPF